MSRKAKIDVPYLGSKSRVFSEEKWFCAKKARANVEGVATLIRKTKVL
jgi:hypothetical protein